MAEAAREHDPSTTTKFVVIHALPIPLEYGINPDLYPAVNLVTEPSTKRLALKLPNFITNAKFVVIRPKIMHLCLRTLAGVSTLTSNVWSVAKSMIHMITSITISLSYMMVNVTPLPFLRLKQKEQ